MSLYLGNIQVAPAILHGQFSLYSFTDTWVRPVDWPDLDSLTIPDDFEGVYLTYDNRTIVHKTSFSLTMTPSMNYDVDVGYINNGNFVSLLSFPNSGSTTPIIDFSEITGYDYVVIKVIATNNNHFTRFDFNSISTTNAGTYAQVGAKSQLCLERRGNLPYLKTISASGYFTTYLMEKDNTSIGSAANITSLQGLYKDSQNLRVIDMSNWKTENWHVTTLREMFCNCYNLEFINFDSWNTSNWAVDSLYQMWYNCYNLKYLNLNSWDTSNWVVTTLYYTWYNCYNLLQLSIEQWDTSNWAVTSLYNTWYNCKALKCLNLNSWNTSNWAVTTLASAWSSCYELQTLSIGSWDTSNWAVTTLANSWSNCYTLEILDLNNWDTTNWAVTSLGSSWSSCWSLKELHISNWDCTNWPITSFASTWSSCYNLREIEAFTWSMHNKNITTFNGMCNGCYNLKEIDLSNWSINSTVTNIGTMVTNCYAAENINISTIDPTTITTYGSSGQSIGSYCYSLKSITLPNNWHGAVNLSSSSQLTRENILQIFDKLADNTAEGSAAVTIYIGANIRCKLTTNDIAILTGKGYTLGS